MRRIVGAVALVAVLALPGCRREVAIASAGESTQPSSTPVAKAPRRPFFCEDRLPASALNDPVALRELIVAIQLREFPPMPECQPGEVCVQPCDEPTQCHKCEMLMTAAMYQFPKIGSESAAANAAALVLDERMEWDGGVALTFGDAVAQIGPRVLPHLRPHTGRSLMAERIIECVEKNERCM
jgi:hypothetical protein